MALNKQRKGPDKEPERIAFQMADRLRVYLADRKLTGIIRRHVLGKSWHAVPSRHEAQAISLLQKAGVLSRAYPPTFGALWCCHDRAQTCNEKRYEINRERLEQYQVKAAA